MLHKFSAKFAYMLLSEEREKQGTAQSVLEFSGIRKGQVAVDFGCGPGFLALLLAKKAEKVYAVDINQEMLDIVSKRAAKAGIRNIETLKSREYGAEIPKKADFVFALSVVHEVVRKRKLFSLFHSLLKEKGKLVVADWRTDPKNWDFGPPGSERVSAEDMEEFAFGLFRRKRKKLLDSQYYLLFEKI